MDEAWRNRLEMARVGKERKGLGERKMQDLGAVEMIEFHKNDRATLVEDADRAGIMPARPPRPSFL